VVDGRVMVEADRVIESQPVLVEVIVVDGMLVTVNVAVGVLVTVTGGAAMIENSRCQAKVRPSTTTTQLPETIWFFCKVLPVTLLALVNASLKMNQYMSYQVDTISVSSGCVGISEQKYSLLLGSTRMGVISP